MGLRERTLIVFSSDHGEAFGEHDGEGHARNVYGEVTQTPLIMSFPFRLDPGIVVEARSENVDLWPTVLELLGLPALPDVDGRSLLPEIVAAARGETPPDGDGVAFAQIDQAWGRTREGPQPMVAVNQGQWRLMFRAGFPEAHGALRQVGGSPRAAQHRRASSPRSPRRSRSGPSAISRARLRPGERTPPASRSTRCR